MPFYEYRCGQCKFTFEELVDFKEPDPKCPQCDGEVSRLLSTPTFSLKGEGWYSDHYGLKKDISVDTSSETKESSSETKESSSETKESSSETKESSSEPNEGKDQ